MTTSTPLIHRQELIHTIKEKLQTKLTPTFLELNDDSHQHADHFAGTDGHFTLTIASPAFTGLSKVQQHQLVYQILGEYIGVNKGIHALSICVQP